MKLNDLLFWAGIAGIISAAPFLGLAELASRGSIDPCRPLLSVLGFFGILGLSGGLLYIGLSPPNKTKEEK